MSATKMILYKLECGHLKLADSRGMVPVIKCLACKTRPAERTWIDIQVDEWFARCRDCKYIRYAGMGELIAGYLAGRHKRANPAHGVIVGYGPNPVAVRARGQFVHLGLITDRE